ncbi:MAG TPA: DMT family transporter [Myxococcota bacterium]|nr:DMT family transporter [Myxococcota bacterium]HRY93038.1 DMT family transporter [Myxococcota bacterium]
MGKVYLILAFGLLAASQSGNIIRLGDAHPAVIAFYRLALAGLVMAALAGARLRQLASLTRAERLMLLLAGAALAGHLVLWIAAVQRTTVANAALFFSVNPLLTAVGAHLLFGERVGRWLGLAIALGLGGIAILGYADLRLEGDDWLGDLLSLACAVFFAAYFLLGKRLRGRLDNRAYVAGVYLVAALSSLAALLALGQPLTGYSPRTWLCFGLMALVPTLLGHTLLNHALRYLDASFVSAATLSEPALAGLVAYFAWGEGVSAAAGLGYALIAGAVLLLILDQREVARRA